MSIRILKDKIQKPFAQNLSWYFPVEVDTAGQAPQMHRIRVDMSDLHQWVKEAIGRYPDSSVGDQRQIEDILANWDPIEQVLQRKFAALVPRK